MGNPVNLLLSPQKCQGLITSFHNLSKFITFAATPLALTPFVRNKAWLYGYLMHQAHGFIQPRVLSQIKASVIRTFSANRSLAKGVTNLPGVTCK